MRPVVRFYEQAAGESSKVEASGADFFWNAGENLKGEIEKGGPFKSKEEALKDGKRSTNFKRLLLTMPK